MNKKLFYLISFICLVFVAGSVFAQEIKNPLSVGTFEALFYSLVSTFMSLLTGLSTLMVTVAGILYLTSAGNPGRMTLAKTALGFACVGLLIGLSGGAIVTTIKDTTSGATDIPTVIERIATQVGILIGSLSTLMFLISGYFYLAATGDPTKIQTAKAVLIYSIIGIVIGLAAPAIVNTITSWAT